MVCQSVSYRYRWISLDGESSGEVTNHLFEKGRLSFGGEICNGADWGVVVCVYIYVYIHGEVERIRRVFLLGVFQICFPPVKVVPFYACRLFHVPYGRLVR